MEKSGGFGNTPCVKAKMRIGTATVRSKTVSTTKLEATAGYDEFGIEVFVRKRRTMFPNRAGNTMLTP